MNPTNIARDVLETAEKATDGPYKVEDNRAVIAGDGAIVAISGFHVGYIAFLLNHAPTLARELLAALERERGLRESLHTKRCPKCGLGPMEWLLESKRDWCRACDDASGRRDAELMEKEFRERLAAAERERSEAVTTYEVRIADLEAEVGRLREALKAAGGRLVGVDDGYDAVHGLRPQPE